MWLQVAPLSFIFITVCVICAHAVWGSPLCDHIDTFTTASVTSFHSHGMHSRTRLFIPTLTGHRSLLSFLPTQLTARTIILTIFWWHLCLDRRSAAMKNPLFWQCWQPWRFASTWGLKKVVRGVIHAPKLKVLMSNLTEKSLFLFVQK